MAKSPIETMEKKSNSSDDVLTSTHSSTSVVSIINKLQHIFAPLGDSHTGLRLPPMKRFHDFSALRREIQILEQHIRNVLPTLKTDLASCLVTVEQELRAYGEVSESKILEQHIRNVLPTLKTDLASRLVAVEKELCAYGEVLESKEERGGMLLNILTNYSKAFSEEVDVRIQATTTNKLSGGARILHIFESIYEVDPCEDLSDEDIRVDIHNVVGPRNALFVPEVPFEVLVRQQIARLLDPSLRCLRSVYDELIKISRACETFEMLRFSELRSRLEDVIAKFLQDGVKHAEKWITKLIDMEMDSINSFHPKFIGGIKEVEMGQLELKTMQMDSINSLHPSFISGIKAVEMTQLELKTLQRDPINGMHPNFISGITAVEMAQLELKTMQVGQRQSDNDRVASAGVSTPRGVTSLFGIRGSAANSSKKNVAEVVYDQPSTVIQLKNPSLVMMPGETDTKYQVEIMVTKLLISSYYDNVKINMQDSVLKATVYSLVNHARSNLLDMLIQKLLRENVFEDLLQEQDDIVTQMWATAEMCHALQQAVQTLDDFDADVSTLSSNASMDALQIFLSFGQNQALEL